MTATNGTKITVEGHEFTIKDLRESANAWQGDEAYYGSKRSVMITGDGQGDRQDFSDATPMVNGEQLWIDGASFILVVTDLKASNGIIFITRSTFDAIQSIGGSK